MINKIKAYFGLGILPNQIFFGTLEEIARQRKLRERKRIAWTIALYLGVLLGVLASQFLDLRRCEGHFPLNGLIDIFIIPLIVATLIFPAVYRVARVDGNNPNGMQFFIAFQEGFFWHKIMLGVNMVQVGG